MHGRRRCRIHGGANLGPPTGNRNAYKHGMRSGDMARVRAEMRALLADCQDLIGDLET